MDHGTHQGHSAPRAAAAIAMLMVAHGVPAQADSSGSGTRVNVALASKGAVVSASSQAAGAPASSLINGDRRGVSWGSDGGWSDNTYNTWPDVVTITFPAARRIDQVGVFSLQDGYANPVEPVLHATTFTKYGARSFSVAYWNGSSWMSLATVGNNAYVWRLVSFPPVETTKVRVTVTSGGRNGWTQLTEVEAWTAAPGECSSHCTGMFVRGCDDPCTAADGATSTCGSQAFTCVGGPALPRCSNVCSPWSACSDRCSADDGSESRCEYTSCERPHLRGVVAQEYGEDVNRCVNDPVGQVLSLPFTGAAEEFSYPSSFPETTGWADCLDKFDCGDHWQTVVRLPVNPDRFLVTLNQEEHPHYSGFLGVLSREAGQAVAMQQNHHDPLQDTAPLVNRYNHPGGAQALGRRYVFVGEEQQDAVLNARVRVYDQEALADLSGLNSLPTEVPSFSTFVLPSGIDDPKGAAAVAVAKLMPLPGESGSRFLMLVASQDFSYRLYYWLSQPGRALTDPHPGWEKGGFLQLRDASGNYTNGWGTQQNMNLLTDCSTGTLYLISWSGNAPVRLHRLAFTFTVATGTLSASIGSNTVAARTVNCDDDGDHCHFKAGAGSYVDGNGDLQVYGTSVYHTIRTAGYCNGPGCWME
jgi:hypothetical protein